MACECSEHAAPDALFRICHRGLQRAVIDTSFLNDATDLADNNRPGEPVLADLPFHDPMSPIDEKEDPSLHQ